MNPGSVQEVILIGVGAAGTTHLDAMEQIPTIVVNAAIDIDTSRSVTFRDKEIPLYRSVAEARDQHPDMIVIATPTPTHAKIYDEVVRYFPSATILIEKPAADSLLDSQRLLTGDAVSQVNVALHMAFAPEVNWAAEIVAAKQSRLGCPVAVHSWSGDPYQSRLVYAESTLGSSWIDSGINSLSVIERFVKVVSRTSLRRIGNPSWSTFEGVFICETSYEEEAHQCEAVILTSWNVTDNSRSTCIKYASGAEVVMDHNAVAAYLFENNRISAMFGSDGSVPRRESHYRQLYQSWLVNHRQMFSHETVLRLHTLLLNPINSFNDQNIARAPAERSGDMSM